MVQEPSEDSVCGNLHRGLLFFGIVFCLGQFGDVLRGVADEMEALMKTNLMESAGDKSTSGLCRYAALLGLESGRSKCKRSMPVPPLAEQYLRF